MEETPDFIADLDVPVVMRDGVVLYTDVYRPARSGRFPVILLRTYGKEGLGQEHLAWFSLLGFIRAGYVVVVQQVRGTGRSGGSWWRPLLDEGADGADSIAWIAAQEWSNGAVGMTGRLYFGAAALLAAGQAPPALRAIAPISSLAEWYDFNYRGGAFELGRLMSLPVFALGQLLRDEERRGHATDARAQHAAFLRIMRNEPVGGPVVNGREQLAAIMGDPWRAFENLPLTDFASLTQWLDETYGEYLRHPEYDDFWRETSIKAHVGMMHTPALHITGWYDCFLNGTLELYQAMRDGAATEYARSNQRLIITPWAHLVQSEVMGELWFGPAADPVLVDLHSIHMEWFDAFLKDEPLPDRDPVRLFVQGVNRWRDESSWPLTRAVHTRWYLHADASLSPRPPSDETRAEYVYDPRDPVPTIGGQTVIDRGGFFAGPRDRRAVHARPDVLLYTSDVVQQDVEVTGPVKVTLHVASSASDTDFTAALIDVYPDGRAIGLTDGILRLRYRDRFDRGRLLEPDRVYEIQIDLGATSNFFLAGHRIAIEISSSNFPRFDRNPNTGGVIAEARESDLRSARQCVFHDANRASYVTLPIVPVV